MICGDDCLDKGTDRERLAITLYCNNWSHDLCAERRLKQLQRDVIAGHPDAFVTFTLRREPHHTPSQGRERFAEKLRLFWQRCRDEATRDPTKTPLPVGKLPEKGCTQNALGQYPRQVAFRPGGLAYFVVFEAHQSGWPHCHIAMRIQWLDFYWMQAQWFDLTGSHRVKIERPRDINKVGWYIAKYVGKAPGKWAKFKRYYSSRNWQQEEKRHQRPVFDVPGEWQRFAGKLTTWIFVQAEKGYQVRQVDRRTAHAVKPP